MIELDPKKLKRGKHLPEGTVVKINNICKNGCTSFNCEYSFNSVETCINDLICKCHNPTMASNQYLREYAEAIWLPEEGVTQICKCDIKRSLYLQKNWHDPCCHESKSNSDKSLQGSRNLS